MTTKTRPLALALTAAALLSLSLTACSPATAPTSAPKPESSEPSDGSCSGVTLIVDTGDLEVAGDPSLTTCLDTEEPISGTDAVAEADLTTEGTTTYPDDVVCRVNGIPSEETELPGSDGAAYHETCADMPSANAYWALWVKPAGGEWDYAQTGLPGLELNPGDSVQLLFTVNGEPAAPTS